jgi:hypothetical protein
MKQSSLNKISALLVLSSFVCQSMALAATPQELANQAQARSAQFIHDLRAAPGNYQGKKLATAEQELSGNYVNYLSQGSEDEQAAKVEGARAAIRADIEARYPGVGQANADAVLARLDSKETAKIFDDFRAAYDRKDQAEMKAATARFDHQFSDLLAPKTGQAIDGCVVFGGSLIGIGSTMFVVGLWMNLKASKDYPVGKGGLNATGVALTVIGALMAAGGVGMIAEGC